MSLSVRVVGLLASIVALIGVPMSSLAQSPDQTPEAADVAKVFGFDPQSGPLVFEGPPILSTNLVHRREALLTWDVHWRQAGRLMESVAADNLRLEAGALLFGTGFRASGLSSDVLPAWCGVGQFGPIRFKHAVCIVGAPDGQARLVEGVVAPTDREGPLPRILVSEAPDWYVSAIRSDPKTTPIPRPHIAPADAAQLPPLQVSIVYEGRWKDSAGLAAFIGLRSAATSRRYMRQITAHADAGADRAAFGRFDLVLETSDQGVKAHWERTDRELAAPASVARAGRPRPTPFVIDGALIDPQRLTVAAGVVHPDDDLLQGPAAHWATAKAVATGMVLFVTFHSPSDAAFHKIETVTVDGLGARSIGQAWCGPMGGLGLYRMFCTSIEADGRLSQTATSAGGRRWMAQTIPASQQAGPASLKQLDVTPSEQDLLGPMTFHLRLDGAGRDLRVHAEVQQGDETSVLWRGSVPFGPDGAAHLPFWSHQIVATKTAGGVTVQLQPTGDGAGPLEIGMSSGH